MFISTRVFISVKYSNTVLEPCFKLLILERKVAIRIQSTLAKRSLRSDHASMAFS